MTSEFVNYFQFSTSYSKIMTTSFTTGGSTYANALLFDFVNLDNNTLYELFVYQPSTSYYGAILVQKNSSGYVYATKIGGTGFNVIIISSSTSIILDFTGSTAGLETRFSVQQVISSNNIVVEDTIENIPVITSLFYASVTTNRRLPP